jgi:DNA modification methylase
MSRRDRLSIHVISKLLIQSPKRNTRLTTEWEGFFPYYAGFPEVFARGILGNAGLESDAIVLDPWNGSGTTTHTASRLGFKSIGLDLNPVMLVVARARLLSCTEADSLEPLAEKLIKDAASDQEATDAEEPLGAWFGRETSASVRAVERSIRRHLVGKMTITSTGTNLDRISSIAAAFYVALFSICRDLTSPFQSSNPTWLRRPKSDEAKIGSPRQHLFHRFVKKLQGMATALEARKRQIELSHSEEVNAEIGIGDTTNIHIAAESVDLILTSPPYCTRIDYTAATRIELAVMAPLLQCSEADLSAQMIGSTRVPKHVCNAFLDALTRHRSKASSGYYYRTHLDYFDKVSRSIRQLAKVLKPTGTAVMVVQDSYYKEIHNNLPAMITEISFANGLKLERQEDFHLRRSMSGINPYTRHYKRDGGATESVLCFQKL